MRAPASQLPRKPTLSPTGFETVIYAGCVIATCVYCHLAEPCRVPYNLASEHGDRPSETTGGPIVFLRPKRAGPDHLWRVGDVRSVPGKRGLEFVGSLLAPRNWGHLLRMVHYYRYSHVEPLRQAEVGRGAAIAPTASFRQGSHIHLGTNVHLGEGTALWAGPKSHIHLGDNALLGPDVYITTSNYQFDLGTPVRSMPREERDVYIGADVWLGARVIVLPGVRIGDGSIVGAGSIVTRDVPPGSVAVGNPARIVRQRSEVIQPKTVI